MEKFGRFIDDIRKEIKCIIVSFEEVPFGETMIISTKYSKKKYVIDTNNIGKIEYDTPMYNELLQMTIEELLSWEEDKNIMSGVLEKKEGKWHIKWSDLHSFAHGTHWMWTPIDASENIDENKYKEGDVVEFYFVKKYYSNETFMPFRFVKLKK